jgi:hypothetical protein
VLLPFAGTFAGAIPEADAALAPRLTDEVLREIMGLVPEEWLRDEPGFADTAAVRGAYVTFLSGRLEEPRAWVRALEEVSGRAL